MRAPRPCVLFPLAIAAGFAMTAHAVSPALASFSIDLDAQWDYAKPGESERRFRTELAKWPSEDPQALIIATQIARTQGLRREFADAQATLDAIESRLGNAPSHVRVRYLLERGRAFNSSGSPERALPLFADALSLAQCDGDEFYAIDAAHMLGITAPPTERLDWSRKGLAMAERATAPRAKRWLAPLYNNIGQTYLEQGDYAPALDYFRKALPAWESRGDPGSVRVAHWMIGRAQRALGQLDDAEKTQRALLAEYEKIGEPYGYVYEELAEIALARGDASAAQPWAAKAHAALEDDAYPQANEPGRLARLDRIAQGRLPATAKP